MDEPDFLAQTGEVMDAEKLRKWYDTNARRAAAEGCTCGRLSHRHEPEKPGLYLFEAWKVKPDPFPKARFQYAAD